MIMIYFKINNTDYSSYIMSLNPQEKAQYNSQINANGDTIVDYINSKYTVEVQFIPMSAEHASAILSSLGDIGCTISFLEPKTNTLKTISCICPEKSSQYYTIQDGFTMLQKMKLKFQEL